MVVSVEMKRGVDIVLLLGWTSIRVVSAGSQQET